MANTYDLGPITAYAIAVENGYEGTEEQFAEDVSNLPQYASDAEAYAVGTRDGIDVGSDDPTYNNNAKYYAGQSSVRLEIHFGSEFEGQTYTVTGGSSESYTGTVPASLVVSVTVASLATSYTVTCDNSESVTYTRVYTTGNFAGINVVYFVDATDFTPTAGNHNSIFRGRYLGSAVTEAQYAAIQAGTFDDLYVGDYWIIPVEISGETKNITWRIAHCDYWLHTGDTECTDHHLVIVPDECLYNAQMNTSNTTSGGYYNSAMRGGSGYLSSGNLVTAKTATDEAFGSSHILNHRMFLTNAISGNTPSNSAWYDSTIDLMNEPMVYGSYIFTAAINGTTWPYLYTESKTQLASFRLAPELLTNRVDWWLRGVVASTTFACVAAGGAANLSAASDSFGVRPAFAIY